MWRLSEKSCLPVTLRHVTRPHRIQFSTHEIGASTSKTQTFPRPSCPLVTAQGYKIPVAGDGNNTDTSKKQAPRARICLQSDCPMKLYAMQWQNGRGRVPRRVSYESKTSLRASIFAKQLLLPVELELLFYARIALVTDTAYCPNELECCL